MIVNNNAFLPETISEIWASVRGFQEPKFESVAQLDALPRSEHPGNPGRHSSAAAIIPAVSRTFEQTQVFLSNSKISQLFSHRVLFTLAILILDETVRSAQVVACCSSRRELNNRFKPIAIYKRWLKMRVSIRSWFLIVSPAVSVQREVQGLVMYTSPKIG